jgi:hypothetical protein
MTPGGAAAATAAASQAARTKRAHKASKTKKQRAGSARTARHQSRSHARGGATQPAAHRAKTRHAAVKAHAKKKTDAAAKLSRVKPLVLTTNGTASTPQTTAPAHGGRQGSAPSAASNDRATAATQDRGIGFNTPRGRFSISPSGFQLGGSQRPIASVGGILSALLVTLAALAAVAGVIGAVAAVRAFRRTRRTTRRRATVAANRRTREQLYSEAKRQNLRGRSSMTKAELERALYPTEQVAEL